MLNMKFKVEYVKYNKMKQKDVNKMIRINANNLLNNFSSNIK